MPLTQEARELGRGRVVNLVPPLLLIFFCVWPLRAAEYDLLLRHGRVVDGTGNPAFFADVAVKSGRVVALGRLAGTGAMEVDATGLIIAPGFIDVHTHADEVAEKPAAENFVRMGVTTIVVGNCGSSSIDVAQFARELEGKNLGVNVGTLLGHGTVRRRAMGGLFERAPTTVESEQMKALVEKAMQDGAFGLSTGLIYAPGVFADTAEIIELAKIVSRHDGIYTSHMRHEDFAIYSALEEFFRICREGGCRGEISHIKLVGPSAWGQTDRVLGLIEQARAQGLDITQDQYAYTASSTGISQLIPDSALEGGAGKFAGRIADPAERDRIVEQMKENLHGKGRDSYAYAVVASYKLDPSFNGRNIAEIAKATRGSDSVENQIDVVLEIQKNGGATGVFHGIDEADLQAFMKHPNTMVASDSGLREPGQGVPHPRGYGNNARVLSRYVRELKVLRLEDALRKMTSLPAATFRLADRGLLRPGYWADITLFNPEKVRDTSQFDSPHHYPEGIPWVIVNGVPVIRNGEHTHAKAGKVLLHRSAAGTSAPGPDL